MITPIEIRQHEFKKTLRGFDKEEVASFLNTLSLQWEKLVEENRRLKIDLDKTTSNLESLKQVESVLHKTLLQAEETSRSTVENAKKDAELKLQEAEGKANEVIKRALTERSRIELQVNELVARRNDILNQLKGFLQGQTERIKTWEEKEMKPWPPENEGQKDKEEDSRSFFESSVKGNPESGIVNEIVEGL